MPEVRLETGEIVEVEDDEVVRSVGHRVLVTGAMSDTTADAHVTDGGDFSDRPREIEQVDPIAADLTPDAGEQTVRIELAVGQWIPDQCVDIWWPPSRDTAMAPPPPVPGPVWSCPPAADQAATAACLACACRTAVHFRR